MRKMTEKTRDKLIKTIKKIQKKECDSKNTKIEYVKENDEIYLVSFMPLIESTGSQYLFTIDKKTFKYDLLFFPDIESFSLLDIFKDKKVILTDSDFSKKL